MIDETTQKNFNAFSDEKTFFSPGSSGGFPSHHHFRLSFSPFPPPPPKAFSLFYFGGVERGLGRGLELYVYTYNPPFALCLWVDEMNDESLIYLLHAGRRSLPMAHSLV